jgi:hypothetical protein
VTTSRFRSRLLLAYPVACQMGKPVMMSGMDLRGFPIVFRFQSVLLPDEAFNSALGLAAHASEATYKTVYSSKWIHPTA